MKFSILQQDLLPVLQAVSRCVGIRSSLPVLDNILFSVGGSKLKVAATNLEIGMIKYVSIEGVVEGEITVPAKVIVDLIQNLPAAKIEFESQNEILSIQSSNLKATISGISSSEFPIIPLSESKGISFSKDILLNCSQILFASAVDEGRPVLTGILTDVRDDRIDFVATDGFRLAHRQVIIPKKTVPFKSLIPRRTFEEVLRVVSEDEVDQISISPSQNQNQIVFTLGQTTVSSRLIEGQFPAWEKIIPQNMTTRILLDKEELLRALKLAAVFAKETNIVVLTIKKDRLLLKSQARQLGSQENEVEVQIEGEQMEIAFNTKFIQDATSAAPSTQLMIELSAPLQPALIKPVGVEGLEYIVMPVRLS